MLCNCVTYAMKGIVAGADSQPATTHSQFWLMFLHAIVNLGIDSL